MLRLSSRWLAFVVLGAALLVERAHAQTPSGRISGVVRDAQGVGLEAARVTVTNNLTRATRSTTTGADGAYGISGLTAGSYTVSTSLVGFRRATRPDVQVTGETTVDFALDPLPLQAITVTATLREQELADVPFSVAAPTASVLRQRGADDIEDIAINVAGFSVQNLGPGHTRFPCTTLFRSRKSVV